jgi:hypothetical protein
MNITDFFRDPRRCKTVDQVFAEKCAQRNKLIAEGITDKNIVQYDALNKWLIDNCGRWLEMKKIR